MKALVFCMLLVSLGSSGCIDSAKHAKQAKQDTAHVLASTPEQDKKYCQEFYQAFLKGGVEGVIKYMKEEVHNDNVRLTICEAVAKGGWAVANSQLASAPDRLTEFKSTLGKFGFTEPNFPTGSQLYRIGHNSL